MVNLRSEMKDKKLHKEYDKGVREDDPTASSRKQDHIEMAFRSQVVKDLKDERFYYEPMLASHPQNEAAEDLSFLGKSMKAPLWVSSMTGGTELANKINTNLAKICGEFGLGMGLGSCRKLLTEDTYLNDFKMRPYMGYEVPFFANLGVAQVETLLAENKMHLLDELLKKLEVDGLVVHVNPMQEWLQPEGDRFVLSPLDTVKQLLDKVSHKIIVKEVGQGMGPASLRELMKLPIAAIEFGAMGGTNFAKLELYRGDTMRQEIFSNLALVGHTAEDMVGYINDLYISLGDDVACKEYIISGGVKSFIDGYYLMSKLNATGIYGQASGFLKYAVESIDELRAYTEAQIQGLALAKAYLKVKS